MIESSLQAFGLRPLDVDSDLAAGGRALFQHLDVDLSTARTFGDNWLPVAGDFLTIDFDVSLSAGVVPFVDTPLRVALANRAGALSTPLPMWHGSTVRAPFYGLSLEHAAVPGGRMRILTGFGVELTHQSRYTSMVRGVTGAPTVLVAGTDPAGMSIFFTNAALASNVPTAIVSAAANTQGIFVQDMNLEASGQCGFVYGTAAPTGIYGNPALMLQGTNLPIPRSVSVPPGQRLDVIASSGTVAGSWSATLLYKLTRP